MAPVLEVSELSKSFARTRALSEVSLTIDRGEVHVLLGQNGSGKSTLIKILSGYHVPDPGGVVRIDGHELSFSSAGQSYRLGCRVVQQDLGLIPTLSVLDNLSLGGPGFPTRLGTIRPQQSRAQAKRDLERLRLEIDPRQLVGTLSASERTAVAIARALREDPAHPPRLLVLDEPTATLPVDEVDYLLDMVRHMAATGVGVLYVTHHLGEVFRVAQRVSVFRDGLLVGSGPIEHYDHQSLVHLVAGEELQAEELEARKRRDRRAQSRTGPPILEVSELRAGPVRGLSVHAFGGEIVGIAGLSGSGRDTVLGAVFGALPRTAGGVRIAGEPLVAGRPDLSIARGVAYLAADRKRAGAVMTMTARENLTLPRLRPFWNGMFLRQRIEKHRTKEWFARLSVRPASAFDDPLTIFSGGNQQKVLFGKWLSQEPALFLLDEPTQGVDVGAKADLHRELIAVAEQGAAVVVSTSDLEEAADLCDRVLIMSEGEVIAELTGDALSVNAITRRFMPAAAEPERAPGAELRTDSAVAR
jgi:ribose transport system ATP-binding protein